LIEAITFDLWNTIFQNRTYSEPRIKFLNDFLKLKGNYINKSMLENCFERIFLPYSNEFVEKTYHIYNDIRLEKVLECLKVNLSPIDKEEILCNIESEMIKEPPLLKPGVSKILKELSLQYKIGLISNTGITPGRIIKLVLEEYDILKYFQVTVFSDEIGYYKPNHLLFQKALKHLGAKPENSIHVGDLLHTDVKGAKDFGMLNIWFNDSNQERDSDIIPDFEVKNMEEIVNIIKNL